MSYENRFFPTQAFLNLTFNVAFLFAMKDYSFPDRL